jgi:hypothetical protein
MKYIYDIMLNFTDYNIYYEFYEWKKSDNLVNVKKILLFRVSDSVMSDLINYDFKVDKNFLNSIKNNFMISKNSCKNILYMCVLSTGFKSIGVAFKRNGKVLYKSSMIVDEENEINSIALKLRNSEFLYKKLSKKSNKVIRDDYYKVNYLKRFIKEAYKEKDYDKLSYLYHEITSGDKDNINDIYHELLKSLDNFSSKHNYLYFNLSNKFSVIEK